MATVYKTPGVYVEEIPKLPPSVAQVETAIPAFVGYTEKAEKDGEDLTNKPTRISSLVDFVQYYGGAHTPQSIDVQVNDANNYAVTSVSVGNTERYMLYDSMRLFFDNGGGDCYIVSVGTYDDGAPIAGDEVAGTGLRGGLKTLEKEDTPTILLFPDAVMMQDDGSDDPAFYSLQQMALSQCAKLQDRVAVLDLKENITGDHEDAVENFRNNIGINNLKYAAAYTPWIYDTYARTIDFAVFRDNVTTDGVTPVDLTTITADTTLNAMVTTTESAMSEVTNVETVLEAIRKANTSGVLGAAATAAPSITDKFLELKKIVDTSTASATSLIAVANLMTFCRNALLKFQDLKTAQTQNFLNDLNTYATSNSLWRGAAQGIISLDRNADVRVFTLTPNNQVATINGLYPGIDATWLGLAAPGNVPTPTDDYGDTGTAAEHPAIGRVIALNILKEFNKLAAFADTIYDAAKTYKKAAQEALYEKHTIIGNIVRHIKKELSKNPPSAAVAGIYAQVDNSRGVWKAPANVSLNSVSGPAEIISHDEQANLNVDALAGKSINAIRAFTGKGTLVWGARTLAGNDNEWRYVSVRRFFNMVEESSKKSTEPFVFEPNDANTWVKVQAMIENYLTNLWRQGALQGAKPEHAFYVAVGLGKTMTAFDILEGRMIVEIGMAVVRPAEFIVLQFSHKMAES